MITEGSQPPGLTGQGGADGDTPRRDSDEQDQPAGTGDRGRGGDRGGGGAGPPAAGGGLACPPRGGGRPPGGAEGAPSADAPPPARTPHARADWGQLGQLRLQDP